MNKNSAMSYLFLIASGIKHHNVKKKKKFKVALAAALWGMLMDLRVSWKYALNTLQLPGIGSYWKL